LDILSPPSNRSLVLFNVKEQIIHVIGGIKMTENPEHKGNKTQKGQPAPKSGSKKVKNQNHSRQNKDTGSDL
jgi:hypothetical protein